jgi:hypothetical protein
MRRLVYCCLTIIFSVVSAVALRGFIYEAQQDHSEGYALLFGLICGGLAIFSLWKLTCNNVNP